MSDDITPGTGEPTEASGTGAPADGEVAAYNHGAIDQVDLKTEMERSYLDYAMSVIVGRALPDVRDGLKPVHRRVLYAMYDGGYRPTASFSKSARIVGDVMGHFHPHGDTAIYDTLVRLVQPWSMRYPLVAGQGNFGSAGDLGAAAPRYTEAKMAPLAMEMVRDIREDTVDFQDNYDGHTQEPVVLPARYPNLLVNGSEGIAVGMATRIPPHNLREVAAGVQWFLDHPEASKEELLGQLMRIIKGPDFPTGATILGNRGIEETYRTGRGSITQRAVVNVEEIQGRQCLVVTELPYQVNPDRLLERMVDGIKSGTLPGIADIRDETSGRAGQRLVIVLKRDAVAKVVLNLLYKHTQLQNNFPANMLALVDGVPRTLSLDGFVRHWVTHQIEVIVRRTRFRLAAAEARMHILEGYLKALDMLDEVIALIRRSDTTEEANRGLQSLLGVDENQAEAILSLQLRRLAALERQRIVDEHAALSAQVADYRDILDRPERQRTIVGEELAEIVEKYGDERRTTILPYDGEMAIEDLIPEETVVVTITKTGYAKRTKADLYRSQRRGGKGVRGAALREDDVVQHFGVCSTHQTIIFVTNLGRVYKAKTYELPEGGRDSRGQHVANLLAFQPDERIASVVSVDSFDDADYLVMATKDGLIKKTALSEYATNRTGGIIGIRLREHEDGTSDSVISARVANEGDDILLVSRQGMSLRFTADDATLRPMGRATSGVTGMKFRAGDELLSMEVIGPDSSVFVVTEGGWAKRTKVSEYRVQGRGGLGIKVAQLVQDRGGLVGALVTDPGQEVLVIMEGGKIVRSNVDEVSATGRNTQGVIFAKPDTGDRIIGIARYFDIDEVEAAVEDAEGGGAPEGGDAPEGGEGATGNGQEDEPGVVPESDVASGADAVVSDGPATTAGEDDEGES